MKKSLKILAVVVGIITILTLCVVAYCFAITANATLDEEKLINIERSISFFDNENNLTAVKSDGKKITQFDKIQNHTVNAFVSVEDKRFYSHKGVDYKGLFRAFFNNITSLSFKEGASTISQQLIKNTHLSNEKTLKRKLIEVKLAKELEKKYTKSQIIEKYLNTIYFGDNCYGITSACDYYFNKSPSEINQNESAMLAGIIKAPSHYSPYSNYKKCMDRKDVVLRKMYEQNYITEQEFNVYFGTDVPLNEKNDLPSVFDYSYMAKKELNSIVSNSPYSLKHLNVYTYLDQQTQNKLVENLSSCNVSCDKSAMLMQNDGKVVAYYSTCGDIKRQLGSVFKPIICYSPAIEYDLVNTLTKIKDEKTDFNGYVPKNYNDKYYGDISVKDSLAVSSNVCAVKLLNCVGIERAKSFINKTDIQLSKNDNSLSLALGALENGASLKEIVGAYGVFIDGGAYCSPKFINKITDENGNIIYQDKNEKTKVFSEETTTIVNDMMKNVVDSGTMKKLSFANQTLYGKSGTVGTNSGNTDAYAISYNSENVLGVWLGNADCSLLPNNVTGGGEPGRISLNLWNELYLNREIPCEIKKSENVVELDIDRISLESDNKIILADENAPSRCVIKTLFKSSKIPKERSTRFSCPVIEKPILSVNNNEIVIQLCLTEYCNALIYREENGKRKLIRDCRDMETKEIFDKDIKNNKTYTYILIPYFDNGQNIFYGKELIIGKIKSPTKNIGDDWWLDDLN